MRPVHVRLAVLRAQRGLSQRQLAALAGVRPDTVSALERGAVAGIRFETLASLCEALSCGPGEIFDVQADTHAVPILGGQDEEELVRTRLEAPGSRVDGASFLEALQRHAPGRLATRSRA